MSKNLENLKKVVEGKSKTIQNYVMLLDDFHRKANSKTQQFIDTLLLFHKAIADKTIKEMSISIGNIVNEQVFNFALRSVVLDPSVIITDYRKKEPILIIKDGDNCIVSFNLTDIEVILHKSEEFNKKVQYFIQLHSKHYNLDYSIIATIKEDK